MNDHPSVAAQRQRIAVAGALVRRLGYRQVVHANAARRGFRASLVPMKHGRPEVGRGPTASTRAEAAEAGAALLLDLLLAPCSTVQRQRVVGMLRAGWTLDWITDDDHPLLVYLHVAGERVGVSNSGFAYLLDACGR